MQAYHNQNDLLPIPELKAMLRWAGDVRRQLEDRALSGPFDSVLSSRLDNLLSREEQLRQWIEQRQRWQHNAA